MGCRQIVAGALGAEREGLFGASTNDFLKLLKISFEFVQLHAFVKKRMYATYHICYSA